MKVFESLGLKQKIDRDIFAQENVQYFVPVDNHIEVHTCVGIICYVLQKHVYTLLFVLGILAALFVWRKQANKKQKQA